MTGRICIFGADLVVVGTPCGGRIVRIGQAAALIDNRIIDAVRRAVYLILLRLIHSRPGDRGLAIICVGQGHIRCGEGIVGTMDRSDIQQELVASFFNFYAIPLRSGATKVNIGQAVALVEGVCSNVSELGGCDGDTVQFSALIKGTIPNVGQVGGGNVNSRQTGAAMKSALIDKGDAGGEIDGLQEACSFKAAAADLFNAVSLETGILYSGTVKSSVTDGCSLGGNRNACQVRTVGKGKTA